MKRDLYLGALAVLVLAAPAARVVAQTTISTDGDVEAQDFIGGGSELTSVDADLLDGMDSSAFALAADLQDVEALLLALGTARVPRTGQSAVFETGDDGDVQLGVTWPNPRFTDNADGTVTDNLTGLIWLDDADCFGAQTWTDALTKATELFDGCASCGGTNNDCGLTDGSVAGEWRLPNVRELQSLVHYGVLSPAVPDTAGTGQWSAGDPFSNVQLAFYWSSTSLNATNAWEVSMIRGDVFIQLKTFTVRVWLVRGGE